MKHRNLGKCLLEFKAEEVIKEVVSIVDDPTILQDVIRFRENMLYLENDEEGTMVSWVSRCMEEGCKYF